MRIHMCGICLWGFYSGVVLCPPWPAPLVAPTPSMPPALAADASQAAKNATKVVDDVAVHAYDQ